MSARLLVLIAAVLVLAVAVTALLVHEPDRQPIDRLSVSADVLVNATVVEMRGYGPDGKPGKFLFDCRATDAPVLGDPTLVCTQRETKP